MKILFFSAPWCGPCQAMKPVFAEVSKLHPAVEVELIDVSDGAANSEKFDYYEVRAVPTIIALKDGKESKRLVGNQPKKSIEELFTLEA